MLSAPARTSSAAWIVLILRFTLAIHVVAAGLAVFVSGIPAGGDPPAWLPAHAGSRLYLYAAVLVVGGALTAVGLYTRWAATAVALALVAALLEWLAVDHLHNTMNHLLPLFIECAVIILLCEHGRRWSADALRGGEPRGDDVLSTSVVVALARVFLGAIFIAQGWTDLVEVGAVDFARDVYVSPLAGSWVPAPLLWTAGVLNPPIQIVTGVLLAAGLFTRPAAIAIGLFLIQILFGHVLNDAFDRGPDVHSYALGNLTLALLVIALAPRGNRFSADALRRRWSGRLGHAI
jgi:uncharacterized membrane protein YphA (DoxX/SURF4 family)